MAQRRHKTIEAAQKECRRLRQHADAKSHDEAAVIEAEWRDDPEYESDYAWLMRMQSGVR